MRTLSDILEHDANWMQKTTCFENTIGHGYLVKNNRVYNGIIQSIDHSEYHFVSAWPEYFDLPLLQIKKIISEKKVPVIASRLKIEAIDSEAREFITFDELPFDTRSFHIHEACHALAEINMKSIQLNSDKDAILKSIIAESVANSMEHLLSIDTDSVEHFVYLKFNSRISNDRQQTLALQLLSKTLGAENLVMILIISYMYSNFLYQEIDEDTLTIGISKVTKIDLTEAQSMSLVLDLCNSTLKLSPKFRLLTNSFYFKSIGLLKDQDIIEFLDFDFLDYISKNQVWKDCLHRLAKSLSKPLAH